jgi:hypothetical protein
MSARGRVALDLESVETIRRALLVGLASYGEVERLADQEVAMKAAGLRVIHPTGNADAVSDFAAALGLLEYAEGLP